MSEKTNQVKSRREMKKLAIIGLVILVIGSAAFFILADDLSGFTKALIFGILFSSSYAIIRLSSEKNPDQK